MSTRLERHEHAAMLEIILYVRATATMNLGGLGDSYAQKLLIWAQMLEDFVERYESESVNDHQH